jgi:hypothetical protein
MKSSQLDNTDGAAVSVNTVCQLVSTVSVWSVGIGRCTTDRAAQSYMIKSPGFTTQIHGRVHETVITHRSAVNGVTTGNTHPLASRGAGTPSGILVFMASSAQVNGLNSQKSIGIYKI